MIYKPYEYQEYAKNFIISKESCAVFLEMGMGKTAITLTAINELLFDYFDIAKVLVIAPKRVAESTWVDEAAKWDHLKHLKISKVLGSEDERIKALNDKVDIYVINRENVAWLVDYYKTKWPFDMVVIDELSSFKSSKAQRFKALRKVRPLIKRVVGLTGTPSPNGLIDLWPQMYLLDKGERLGRTLTAYRERFFEPDKRNRNIVFSYKPKDGAEDEIYKSLSDICLSMKAEDYLKLPELIKNYIPVRLKDDEYKKYKTLEKDLLLPFKDGDIVASSAAVLVNKLMQFANGAVYDENGKVKVIHDEKIKALEDIIEAANGKPVLVFYSYKHDLERLKKYFKDAVELKGQEEIERWNDKKINLLLAHPASCGHGLNLQAGGNIIVWFSLTWSLELYNQANARLYRQGQKENVIIHHLIAERTIDETIIKMLEKKYSSQEALINAVKARLKEENTNERFN